MSSTTTIRIPERLKARIARAAKRAGTTPHSFILDAIAEKTDQDERRSEFHDSAERRDAGIAATGKAIPWSDMRRYVGERIAGKRASRPAAKKLAR